MLIAQSAKEKHLRALVTGGAGFIGHHLVRALLEQGDEVAVLDDLSTGRLDRLAPFQGRILFVEGDVRDAQALDRAAAGCEVIFHEGGLPSVARSVREPRRSNDVNTSGMIEVMLAAARHGARRVIFAGSSSVYGDSPEMPRRETQTPRPRSPYATSKLAAEFYLHQLGELHGIETVALRYFNIFGPGQDLASEYAAVVPLFVSAAFAGVRPVIYGDGTQSRDFTYVDNAISANLLAASAPVVGGLTCNIGCGARFSLLDLLAAIGTAIGREVEPTFEPARQGDVPFSEADIGLAQTRLGYAVKVPFHEGVMRTIDAYRPVPSGGATVDGRSTSS
jgi:UDP-glucose 4-epimerase